MLNFFFQFCFLVAKWLNFTLSIDEYKTLLEINNFEFIKYHKDENIFAWIARNK